MKTCPSCGKLVPDIAKFCGECGKEIGRPPAIVCRVCKREMDPNDKYCLACGFGNTDMGPSSSSSPIPMYAPPSHVPEQTIDQSPRPYNGSTSVPQPSPVDAHPLQPSEPMNDRLPDPLYTPLAQYGPFSPGVKCRSCGRDLITRRGRCESCGNKVPFNRRYDFSVAAGLLVIFGAIINLVIFVTGLILSIQGEYSALVLGVFLLGTIANFYAIWAGYQAIKRKHYDHCVAAYVIITFGPSIFLTVPGLLLLTLSRHNFHGVERSDPQ